MCAEAEKEVWAEKKKSKNNSATAKSVKKEGEEALQEQRFLCSLWRSQWIRLSHFSPCKEPWGENSSYSPQKGPVLEQLLKSCNHWEGCWSRRQVWGGRRSRKELLWTNHYPVFPLPCTTWRVQGSGLRNNGVKLNLGEKIVLVFVCTRARVCA